MTRLIRIATLGAAAVVLAACQGMSPPVDDPEPDPEPPAGPILEGTWTATFDYDDEGEVITAVHTLTFTKSRAILHQVESEGEDVREDFAESSGWTMSGDNMVTRTWYEEGETRTVDKGFAFDGTDLLIDPWGQEEPAEAGDDRRRYTRVEDALPASMTGSWAGPRYEQVDGVWTFTETWRFILRADGTATFEVEPTPDFVRPGLPTACWHGTLTLDAATLTLDAAELRFAYAPFTNVTSSNSHPRAIAAGHELSLRELGCDARGPKVWRPTPTRRPTPRANVIRWSSFWPVEQSARLLELRGELAPADPLHRAEQEAAVWLDNPQKIPTAITG